MYQLNVRVGLRSLKQLFRASQTDTVQKVSQSLKSLFLTLLDGSYNMVAEIRRSVQLWYTKEANQSS
jgi:hypothetical protein